MSLKDAQSKMSKSAADDMSRINLTDDADTIAKKIKRAKADSTVGISYDPEKRPEVSNLLTIYSAMTSISIEEATKKFESANNATFKQELTDALVQQICPIGNQMKKFRQNLSYVDQVLEQGAQRARTIAEANMRDIKKIVGFI